MHATDTHQAATMDVAYVAHLARMNLTPEETRQFQAQLNRVLDYVQEIRALDVDGVEPMAHAIPVHNVFRDDRVVAGLDRETVMSNAPASRDGQFLVPVIVE